MLSPEEFREEYDDEELAAELPNSPISSLRSLVGLKLLDVGHVPHETHLFQTDPRGVEGGLLASSPDRQGQICN
ncbi:hypothetical protein [Halorhabdus amylolytica]|uniref:hypothetical protein n=1 Tax=Halorhabdus amylolytica TaxID=2559573 RepID=UPI0010AA3ADA|nr:hypothetical protein [Halorhabdus amylolytica]